MDLTQAVSEACKQPTLVEALSWIAVWECERAMEQRDRFKATGVRTGAGGAGWDTCFRFCFEAVMKEWKGRQPEVILVFPVCRKEES